MKNKARLMVVLVLAVVVADVGTFHGRAANSPLKGVWRAAEMGTAPNAHRAVGLAIFADTHYSIMVFDAEVERPDVADVSKASADEMRGLWAGWVANTGTYAVNGDLVTIHPTGAKIPVVMKSGANEVYQYKIDENTLTWTQHRNARGVDVTNGPTYRFVREE